MVIEINLKPNGRIGGWERVRKRWSKFWDFEFWNLGFWILDWVFREGRMSGILDFPVPDFRAFWSG